MYLDRYREIITSSVHNIPARLKMIDKNYFLVFNHQTHQYEVHHSKQVGNTFAVSIPYDELDERTLQRVKETRIEYIDKIVAEMEKKNEELEKAGDKKIKDFTQTAVKEIYRYCKNHESKETIDEDSKYFKDVV